MNPYIVKTYLRALLAVSVGAAAFANATAKSYATSETVLYSFNGSVDGKLPCGALAVGPDHNFYGTCSLGGAYGSGTLFKITPAGAFTLLYTFTGGNDGADPQ